MFFKRTIWLMIGATLGSLGACVNKQKIAVQPTQITVQTDEQAKAILSGDQVFCQGECPNSVASFFLYHNTETDVDGRIHRKVVQCSATLIAKDKILTNNHCIEGLLKEGDVLSQIPDISIEVKFPKTKTAAFRSIKARKVLRTSADFQRRMAPDWAIIQLVSSVNDRDPVKAALGDIENAAAVELFPVYFDDSFQPVAAVIKQVRCQLTYDGATDIFATDSQSPLFRVTQCDQELVSGNSGTGVFLASAGQLLGVMASGDGGSQSAAGTMAHCLPNFSSSGDECFYSDDGEYTEISKQLAALNSFVRQRDLSAQDWNIFLGFRLGINNGSPEIAPVLEFNPPWSDYLQYIEKSGDQNLKKRFLKSFSRALFPVLPECIEKDFTVEAAASDLRVPLMNMEVWDLRSYEWSEKMLGGESKSSSVTYTRASGNSFVMPVKLSLKAKGREFILESASELPAPIKKFSLRLAVCR